MSFPLSRPLVLLLILLAVFISLDSLGERKLANPDEGRYSEIAREMAQSGDFITPRLNGLKYFEKPPMQYWATAIAFKLFGESEFTARLYTALCGLGCVLLVAYLGRRLHDEETGLLSALVLLSAPYFGGLAEIPTLDMGLTFWLTLSITAFLISQNTNRESSRRRWLLTGWAGMACAVLSKGLIGIVFPGTALFLYCVVHRNFQLIGKLEWTRGVLLFLALTAPWFVAVSIQNPEFARFFFIHEHFERFLTTQHRRVADWWFFLPILFVGFLPWMFALLPAAFSGWRSPQYLSPRDKHFAPQKFALLFCIFILLFFSKSSSKLPAYILPIFPPLALVIGVWLRRNSPHRISWMVLPVLPVALIGAYAAWRAPAGKSQDAFSRPLYDEMSLLVVTAALAIAGAVVIAFILFRFQRKWLGVLTLSIGTMIGIELIEHGYEKISPLQSGAALAEVLKPRITPQTRIYAVETYDQSLPFYLKRTLTLVNYSDEFALGQAAEPDKWIARTEDFPAAWAAPGPAVAIIQPIHLERMQKLGLEFDVIHRDPRRVAIFKPPSR
ncbi:MAG: glycosyltransferase family 39 protein [Betaproteobacteria bacterium]|nr:glycosyltransferase family 39 protein [Betaproteobacteria bacterium]